MKTDLIFLKPIIGGHPGGCYRELLDLWKENNFCIVKPIIMINNSSLSNDETMLPESRCWVNEVGDILLYDNPLLDKIQYLNWNKALFANEVLKKENCYSWIWWPRWPKKFYEFQKKENLSYEERNVKSIFIGNFTTNQRSGNWQKYIEFFRMGNINNHHEKNMLYKYEDYLDLLSKSKFGLALRGVGPKSLREAEYFGLGIVPIFDSNVFHNCYDPLEEGKHYFRVNKPEEIEEIINNCSKDQWEYMSNEGKKWFERNCSLEGSFNTTINILEDK